MSLSEEFEANSSRWQLLKTFSDGHRYYLDCDNITKVAIADNSGSHPGNTEDGILWVDFSQPIEIGSTSANIPVLDGNDELSTSPATLPEAMWLASEFSLFLQISNSGERYRTHSIAPTNMRGAIEKEVRDLCDRHHANPRFYGALLICLSERMKIDSQQLQDAEIAMPYAYALEKDALLLAAIALAFRTLDW